MYKIEELGSEVLRDKNLAVTHFDTNFLNQIEKMTLVLRKARGVGLAAPQVGINETFFITDAPDDGVRVFVNPKIISSSVELEVMEEGCLSVPGIWGEVSRPKKIVIEALNEEGTPFKLKISGYLARIIQHEYDHLNGVLFIDYLNERTQIKALNKFTKKAKRLLKKQEDK